MFNIFCKRLFLTNQSCSLISDVQLCVFAEVTKDTLPYFYNVGLLNRKSSDRGNDAKRKAIQIRKTNQKREILNQDLSTTIASSNKQLKEKTNKG